MRRAEQLHEEILAQMDLSKEASDEELLELIHRILEEKSKKNRGTIFLHPVNSRLTFLLKMEIAYR